MNHAGRDKRPLYARVHAELVERIRSGQWKPGEHIPNEFEIAAEFRVSQGTARKAIGALAAENLVVRRQGRGTFVFEHTPSDVLFRFFNIFEDSGARIVPVSRSTRWVRGKASPAERKTLRLARGARVVRVDRIRTRGSKPFITETVVLPEAIFPGLADLSDIPDTFYDIFQKIYGVLVTRTDERITAATAHKTAAKDLGVSVGTPLIKIDRIAFALDDRPVEWRQSLCHLKQAHYLARTR
ncbi:MAG: GntR family transcriptional regulator [Hyphomonadaceae bacterium]|nr:GntR family transcriptional regulator [Hyphomonadaceae bacterium]